MIINNLSNYQPSVHTYIVHTYYIIIVVTLPSLISYLVVQQYILVCSLDIKILLTYNKYWILCFLKVLKQTNLYLIFTTNFFSLMKIKDVFKNGFNIYYLSYICNIQESNYYVHYSLRIRFHNYYMFFCVQTWGRSINVRLLFQDQTLFVMYVKPLLSKRIFRKNCRFCKVCACSRQVCF